MGFINIPLSEAVFETDPLTQFYINMKMRADPTFIRAFRTNLTKEFFTTLAYKVQNNEPESIGIIGNVRSGKSTCGIFIGRFMCGLLGKKFSIEQIVGNQFEFPKVLRKIGTKNVIVVDEMKSGVYGIGKMSQSMNIFDIQNIIAVNEISTVWITPRSFRDTNSNLGLKVLGKAKNTNPRLIRCMFYNLKEEGKKMTRSLFTPLGLVYIPHYEDKNFEKMYLEKKLKWVEEEQKQETTSAYVLEIEELAKQFTSDLSVFEGINRAEMELYIRKRVPAHITNKGIELIIGLIKAEIKKQKG